MTNDGEYHYIEGQWDMIIAFPPCTHLCNSGQRWFTEGKKSIVLQRQAIAFFYRFVMAKCERIAIENPVGAMSAAYRKPDQIIQPYEYGHPEIKTTCLWLKGLPKLQPTNILKKPATGWENQQIMANGRYGGVKAKKNEQGKSLAWNNPETAKIRSRTYEGIAKAMAQQWG